MRNTWVSGLGSARTFPKAARLVPVSAAVAAYALIVFGSHVRVTESGMGCPDWPLCYGQAGPILEFHALMEQGHRYLAGAVSLLVSLTAVVVFWYRRSRPAAVRPAMFTLAMLGVQVLLGAVTVFAGNGSPTVALHLIAGLTLLGGATVTALCTLIPKVPVAGPRLPRVAWVAVTAVGLLLVAGSLIVDAGAEGLCPSVPFCPVGNTTGQTVVHLAHRTVALLTAAAVWTFAVHAWRRWVTVRGARALAVVSSGMIVVTAGVGITSALLMAPPEWADLHLAGAAAVMVSVVSLATIGWLAGAEARQKPGGVDRGDQDSAGRLVPAGFGSPETRVRDGLVGVALAIALMIVGYGVAVHRSSGGPSTTAISSADATVAASGHTTTVDVSIEGMSFTPGTIAVPAGDSLVINLTNNGDRSHDLVLDSGQRSARLAPGETELFDAGVATHDMEGWCSVAGHRWMGMTLQVTVTGTDAADAATDHDSGTHDMPPAPPSATGTAADDLDLMGTPGEGFTAHKASLPAASDRSVHRIRLPVVQSEQEVAPGVRQTRWTFAGTAPGPTLRGRVGDRFVVTLVNRGDIGHSIDFHAGALAPDRPMRTIEPGQKLRYTFTATRAGIWLYHCSTMPMSMHIANGMFGAVIIDPPNLPAVDKEFLLVQSELYLGPQLGTADAAALAAEDPDLVVFNGYAGQYDHRPLRVRAGDRLRIWVIAAGPNRGTAFHIVGGQFDTVYSEGHYQLRRGTGGSQVLGLATAQGGFVETSLPEPGHYPFVSHAMIDAERGAHGLLTAKAS